MKVLIACEFSGVVREAFRARGHEVMSCDLLPTELGGGQHHEGDVLEILDRGWDLMIAHPPCTYLTYAATRHWNKPGRAELREQAAEFFMKLINAPIEKIAVENPVGYMNKIYQKPTQIIHPYYFGEPVQKRTCLWLKNLPVLAYADTIIAKPEPNYICQGEKCKGKRIGWCEGITGSSKENPRWKMRSKTFQGIANAMAEQWG